MEKEFDSDSEDERMSDWSEDEEILVKSLFDETIFTSICDLILADHEKFNFDLRHYALSVNLEDLELIMLVNFIRNFVERNQPISSSTIDQLKHDLDNKAFQNEEFMRPALENDALLFMLKDSVLKLQDREDEDENPADSEQTNLESMKQMLSKYQDMIQLLTIDHPSSTLVSIPRKDSLSSEDSDEPPPLSTASSVLPPLPPSVSSNPTIANTTTNNYYFDSYSNLDIHETMLKDFPRTKCYEDAILRNMESFKDKIVMDVGCGTGILSLFAAKAGAKKVYAIDFSEMAVWAERIVRANNMDHIVTVMRTKIEDIKELPNLPLECEGKVDIIVSEWMGYGLYFENMFSSVLIARERFLRHPTLSPSFHSNSLSLEQEQKGTHQKVADQHQNQHQDHDQKKTNDGSLMLPSVAEIYIQCIAAPSTCEGDEEKERLWDRVRFWQGVHGWDMRCLSPQITKEAQVQEVLPDEICSTRCLAHSLDLSLSQESDLDFMRPFKMTITRPCLLSGLVLSFDTLFDGPGMSHVSLLSTAVESTQTHWRQTALWFDLLPEMRKKNESHQRFGRECVSPGDQVIGRLIYTRNESNLREYRIIVEWEILPISTTTSTTSGEGEEGEEGTKEEEVVLNAQHPIEIESRASYLHSSQLFEDWEIKPLKHRQTYLLH